MNNNTEIDFIHKLTKYILHAIIIVFSIKWTVPCKMDLGGLTKQSL